MKVKFKILLMMLLACLAFPIMAVGEENVSYSEMMARLQQLEAQMESQQREFSLASYEMGGGAQKVDGCDECCDPCYRSGFYAVYENVIVQPFFTRNNAYYLENPPGTDGQVSVPFDWDYSYSPRIELGRVSDCGDLGFRARYWHFDDEANLLANDPNGDISAYFQEDSADDIGFEGATDAFFQHSLKMDVVDIEAAFRQCAWTYSAGVRYARMDQRYFATDFNDIMIAEHNFDGWGVTAAAEFIKPWRGGLSFFGKARGSLLYGQSGFVAYNPNNDGLTADINSEDVLAVGELQVGIDWRRCLASGRIAFLTLALESQYWASAGAGGPGNNAVFDEGNYHNSRPQDANLGFFGVNIGLGLLF